MEKGDVQEELDFFSIIQQELFSIHSINFEEMRVRDSGILRAIEDILKEELPKSDESIFHQSPTNIQQSATTVRQVTTTVCHSQTAVRQLSKISVSQRKRSENYRQSSDYHRQTPNNRNSFPGRIRKKYESIFRCKNFLLASNITLRQSPTIFQKINDHLPTKIDICPTNRWKK